MATPRSESESAHLALVGQKSRKLERRATKFRAFALLWTGSIVLTFVFLGLDPPPPFTSLAAPIFIAGAIVAAGFFIGLVWWPWSEVEAWLGRVEMLLRWQVANGVIIAFTIAFAVRPELRLPFIVYGIYLILTVLPSAAISLIALRLRDLYRARDRLVAEAERRRESQELKRLIAHRQRPLIAWPWHREKTRAPSTPPP